MSPSRKKLRRQVRRSSESRRRVQITLGIIFLISVFIFSLYMGRSNVQALCHWDEPQEVMVIQGDSLWSIAQSIPGSEHVDLRKVVHEIKKLNGLKTSSLSPGQVLIIPGELR